MKTRTFAVTTAMTLIVTVITGLTVLVLPPAPSAQAKTQPSLEEIRRKTEKYLRALKAKNRRVDVFNAKRILKYLKTHPKAARGMYRGYKRRWDKILGWQETKSQKHLKELRAKAAAAGKLPFPTDNRTFKRYEVAWRRVEGVASYHLKTFCTGKTDKTCAPARKIRDEAIAKAVQAWKHGLRCKVIPFDALQDLVIDGERNALYASHVKLDKWVPQLAQEKKAYWKKQLKGGLSRYGRAQGGVHVCVPQARRGSYSARKLQYLFKSKDTAYIRCRFHKPPRRFKRAGKDYWRVSIHWAGGWEKLLVDEVRRPSRRRKVDYKLRLRRIPREIQRRIRTSPNKYPGNWARVEVAYVVITIKGYRWKKGRRVPIYKHTRQIGTSFYVRWKK